jgi:hypothetical protein
MVALTQEDAARMGGLVDRYDNLPLGTTDASVIAITECEERANIAIATDLPFGEFALDILHRLEHQHCPGTEDLAPVQLVGH